MENTTLNPAAEPDSAALAEINGNTEVATQPNRDMGGVSLLSDTGSPLSMAEIRIAYGVGGAVGTGIGAGALCLVTGEGDHKLYQELAPVGKPMTFVCTGVREVWREWREYQPGVLPKEYASLDDVKAGRYIGWDGKPESLVPLTTTWSKPFGQGGEPPQASPCMYLQMLVRKPEKTDAPEFCLNLGGHWYCPAWMRCAGSLYKGVQSMIRLVLMQDASNRKVAIEDARPDKVFLTLTTYAHVKNGKSIFNLIMAQKLDDNNKVERVPDTFFDEIKRLVLSAKDMPEDNGDIIDAQ